MRRRRELELRAAVIWFWACRVVAQDRPRLFCIGRVHGTPVLPNLSAPSEPPPCAQPSRVPKASHVLP
eukprot:2515273-Prymnesium_polylepis.1